MKHVLLITVFIISSTLNVLATAQYPDKIIYHGTAYNLHTNPLEPYFEKNPEKKPKSGTMSTALWRGYVATFLVTNQVMQLKDVQIEVHVEKEEGKYPYEWKSVVNKVVPENGPLKIDWFTGILVLPYGELVNYVHMGYGSTYENYILLEVKEGKITGKREFDYKQYETFKAKQFAEYKKDQRIQRVIRETEKRRMGNRGN